MQAKGLAYGTTAHLRWFDITVQRFEYGKDQVSAGFRTKTCATARHPQAGPDGRVRVSTDPWVVQTLDPEGGEKRNELRITDETLDRSWSPLYTTRLLGVGECQEGWIAFRHGSPDVQFPGITYAPADGDTASWQG